VNKKLLFIIAFILLWASTVDATTYWISPTGAAANLAACAGETPLSGTDACSYDKANGSGVAAGDTVYYREGTYTISGTAISPYNTGTNLTTGLITFSAYNSEVVEFVNTSTSWSARAINLNSRCQDGNGYYDCSPLLSYIKVHGIKFTTFNTFVYILGGSHNEISNCNFNRVKNQTASGLAWQGSWIYYHSQYNYIHDNIFYHYGAFDESNDHGVLFEIGVDEAGLEADGGDATCATSPCSGVALSNYNLLENNTFLGGGHHVLAIHTKQNLIRGNYIANPPWWPESSPLYADRNWYMLGAATKTGRNLIELNRTGYGGDTSEVDECGGSGGSFDSPYNIIRYNTFIRTPLYAMMLSTYPGIDGGHDNKIYNNTFWHNGYLIGDIAEKNCYDAKLTHALNVEEGASGTSIYGNSLKNNLFYDNNNAAGDQYSIISRYYSGGWVTRVPIYQDIGDNWLDNEGDPLFTNITGTPDPTNATQFDFSLQSESTAIDTASYLTQANGAGNSSTTLIVDDAGYFFYDWGTFSTNIPAATIASDWICVGTVSNCVQISSINYATNTITLASAITWADEANVWLYKNSSGTQVLYGDAPDYGAFEYNDEEAPTQYTLTVNKAGTGTGGVTSSPAGIDCGASCAYDYDEDTEVTLTATPTGDNVFAGWSGTGGCTGTSTCVLTMSAAKAATATFNLPTLPVRFSGGGFSGTIQ
jgi:hypothetical protein